MCNLCLIIDDALGLVTAVFIESITLHYIHTDQLGVINQKTCSAVFDLCVIVGINI